MKFKYTPDSEGPKVTTVYGITFEDGKAVEVEKGLEVRGIDVCAKLEAHPLFAVVKERAKRKKPEAALVESEPSTPEAGES